LQHGITLGDHLDESNTILGMIADFVINIAHLEAQVQATPAKAHMPRVLCAC
jgi:hypothetical protein